MKKPRLPAAIYAIGATRLLNDASSEIIFPLLAVFLSSVLGAGAATLGVIRGKSRRFCARDCSYLDVA